MAVQVSVIVPAWNVEKYIRKCLDSLVNQTLSSIEIIVVNDGSPDNSQDIIDEYVNRYPGKIISIIQENGGQGSARNKGLTVAKGEFVGYVDPDDYIDVTMFEKLYKCACSENADIAICGNYIFDDSGKMDIETTYANVNYSEFMNAIFGKMAVWNKIYRKSLLLENNITFRSKVWYEDLDFSVKTILKANKITYVDEPLYYYYLRAGSTMNNSNVKRNLEQFLAHDELITYCKQEGIYEERYSLLEILCIDHLLISTTVRIERAKASSELRSNCHKEIRQYMNNRFPNYTKNEYISYLPRNRRIILKLIEMKMYKMVKLLFVVKSLF